MHGDLITLKYPKWSARLAAVGAGYWLRAQLGLSPGASYTWPLHVTCPSHNMEDDLEEGTFQVYRNGSYRSLKAQPWKSHSVTYTVFHWSKPVTDLARCKRRVSQLHFLMGEVEKN